jgi:antitoxin YefM
VLILMATFAQVFMPSAFLGCSQSDLSSCIETVYLLKSPVNVRHLMASLEEYRSGKLVPQSIEELRQEFGISGE